MNGTRSFLVPQLITSKQTFLHLQLRLVHLAEAFIESDLQLVHLSNERETIYPQRNGTW